MKGRPMSTSMERVPFVEANRKGARQRPTSIVILSSGTTSDSGAALGIAQNWHRARGVKGVCHYVLDEANTYQCVPDGNVANVEQNGHEKGTIRVLLCVDLLETELEWRSKERVLVLDRAAKLIAQLAYFYKIPPRYIDAPRKPAWYRPSRKGISVQVAGHWPTELFLFKLKTQISAIR